MNTTTRLITPLLCFLLLAFGFSIQPLYACEQYQAKLERYVALKRKGGKATQMNRWSRLKKEASEQYQECLRAQPRIHRTDNSYKTRQVIKPKRAAPRSTSSENPITQRLLNTCNFWIATYNHQPDNDNKSFRDTACRALDQAEQNPPVVMDSPVVQRSVKECIKPGNILDDDVHDCMQGTREPEWRKARED